MWRKRLDDHVAGLGRHNWNVEIEQSLADLRLGVFKLIVKLASTDSYSRLNSFEERLRICGAIRSMMRKQKDVDFALENLAAT